MVNERSKDTGVKEAKPCSATTALIIFLVLILLLLVVLLLSGTNQSFKNVERFLSKGKEKLESIKDRVYNPLYTSENPKDDGAYVYIQGPGDVGAMAYGNVGQGTSGAFFPIQGPGAQTFMKNSDLGNYEVPSGYSGQIGGAPNYTDRPYSSQLVGFNSFGSPFESSTGDETGSANYTNSYLISGSNERVLNPGQMNETGQNLNCGTWWPAVGGSSCEDPDVSLYEDCANGNEKACKEFAKVKDTPRWKKVQEAVKQAV